MAWAGVRVGLAIAVAAVFVFFSPGGVLAGVEMGSGLRWAENQGVVRVAGGVSPARFVPGEVVVGYEAPGLRPVPGRDLGSLRGQVLARLGPGAKVKRSIHLRGMRVAAVDLVRIPAGWSVSRAVASLRQLPGVAFAEPNYLYRVAETVPDDPLSTSSGGSATPASGWAADGDPSAHPERT